jgi:hypothetical protein
MPEPRDPLLKVLKIWSSKLRQQKDNTEFTKNFGEHGPENFKFSGGLTAGPPKQQVKNKQGWPGGRSYPFKGDLHGALMILPQVHLRNG